MTNSEAVSKIEGSLRGLNKDSKISRRLILQTLRENSKVLISQKLMERTLDEEMNLYSYLPCLEFEKIETVNCPLIEFRKCDILMKSVNKIPLPIFSRLGASIKNVTSIDGNTKFTLISSSQYAINKKRQYQLVGENYIYYNSDQHLYIPDKEIRTVNLEFITIYTEEIESCSNCLNSDCKSGWEYNFICPDKLLNAVFDKTTQYLLSTYKQITPDENPNGSETQR
jgi:hypothetical protein